MTGWEGGLRSPLFAVLVFAGALVLGCLLVGGMP